MNGAEMTKLDVLVDHAVECGRVREALDLLWAALEEAQATDDAHGRGIVFYLAQRIHDRNDWGITGEASRIMNAASRSDRRQVSGKTLPGTT